jgi:hypothetical protein
MGSRHVTWVRRANTGQWPSVLYASTDESGALQVSRPGLVDWMPQRKAAPGNGPLCLSPTRGASTGDTAHMEQSANVYKRESELIVASYSKTTAGLWVMNGWLRQLHQEADDESLGVVIVSALDASENDIDVPVVDPNPDAPLLKMLGLRSYGVFMVGTQCVRISRDGDTIQVTPKRNGGGRNGFTELTDRIERLETPTAQPIGTAVRDGLQRTL